MENVYLVGAHLKKSHQKISETHGSLDELERLVETAGGQVVGRSVQALEGWSPSTLIGKGKAEELRRKALRGEFATLVFDEELKPVQHKNLAEMIPVKILDRTRLILDIFAKRARTREGILQVELAQISYLLPRITERYGRFEQQVGGIGTRGPGERKLEVEARHIRDRIAHLRRQIDSLKLHRDVARRRRQNVPLPTVAIVGYTNAGKSTLLNKLVSLFGQSQETVYADDKLFATLDPTTRRVRLPSGRWALFTDTVGFIDKLPTHLVAAFRSTLEETLEADVLLLLVDSTDPNLDRHFQTVLEILESLSGGKKDFNRMVLAYNKTDLLKPGGASKDEWPDHEPGGPELPEPVQVSAATGAGLNRLLDAVEAKLAQRMVEADLYIPFSQSRLLDSIYRLGQVESVSHERKGTHLHMRLEKSHWEKVQKMLAEAHRK